MSLVTRLLVLASVFVLAKGQEIGAELDACAKTCVNNLANGGSFGCKPGETSCICAKPDFAFGVRDCAKQACSPDIVVQATNFVSTFCATATLATVTTTPNPAAAAPTTTSTSSTSRPIPSSALQATAESSTSTTSSTTSSTPAGTHSDDVASTTTSAAKASSSAAKDKDDEDDNDEAAGLSVGAKAGIGIVVAMLGTGLIGLVFWLLRRSRNRSSISTGEFNISGPMPGSGRDYADSHLDYNKEDNTSELELRSRRYEDMLPRQQPASMI